MLMGIRIVGKFGHGPMPVMLKQVLHDESGY
jgi:hypothetical protein